MNAILNVAMLPLLGGAFVFVSVFLLVTGGSAILDQYRLISRRLAAAQLPDRQPVDSAVVQVTLEDGLLKRFEDLVTPKNPAELERIRKRLLRAGYRRPSAIRVYYALKAGLAISLALIAAIVAPFLASRLSAPFMAALIVFPGLIGYLLPSFWIERQLERRREAAELGFPDALDMILVCIEAGNSIDQACRRVSREIAGVNYVLGDEFEVVNSELWAGKERAAVFADFADRLNVSDIRAFATVLKQSDQFGVSIAETLRVYASEMRNKRVMRAEEKANLMPVKLAMGSILFTVPPTMLIMAGPSLIMMLRVFAGIANNSGP